MSLRTANSWVGMARLRATSLHTKEQQPQLQGWFRPVAEHGLLASCARMMAETHH
jgi:hypothetical protein